MSLRISDMSPLSGTSTGLVDEDMFEMTQQQTLQTYSVTAEEISNYVMRNGSNGRYCGVTTLTSLDTTGENGWNAAMAGVWFYNPADTTTTVVDRYTNAVEFTSCYVEIISYLKSEDNPASFLQRISGVDTGEDGFCLQRFRTTASWSPWVRLDAPSTHMLMDCGISTNFNVTFSTPFPIGSNPIVTVQVINQTTDIIHVPVVTKVDRSGFTVGICKSQTIEQKTETTTTIDTTTSGGDENGTKRVVETTSVTESGAKWEWLDSGSIGFYWQAMCHPPLITIET